MKAEKINQFALSLSDDTFNALKSDFDQVLGRTLDNMENKESELAEMTIKVKIMLDKRQIADPDNGGQREIVVPKFDHKVSSVMQVKYEKKGMLSGDYELVFDRSIGKYVIRNINDGQTSMFDKEPTVEDIPSEMAAIGAGSGIALEAHQEGKPEAIDADFREVNEPKVMTPFDWVKKFIGAKLTCKEAMGIYTIRGKKREVVLSSGSDKDSPFFVTEDALKGHIDHEIECVGYPADSESTEPATIAIRCKDCNAVLFAINAPTSGEEGTTYDYEEPSHE